MTKRLSSPRCVALVGPYLSGKTTLLESLLLNTNAITRKGSVKNGTSVGDFNPEARTRSMSTDLCLATTTYLDEEWTIIDCPGSIELGYQTTQALMVADVVVVVFDIAEKALVLDPLFKFLHHYSIPHLLFLNKIDTFSSSDIHLPTLLQELQDLSERPLVVRQIPIYKDEKITGYVDLVKERAYAYKLHHASDIIPVPESVDHETQEARRVLLETLADFDDTLLEQLLEDVIPEKTDIYHNLTVDFNQDRILPVFFGSGENDHGIRRLLKVLRHEVPEPLTTIQRTGILKEAPQQAQLVTQVFKCSQVPHTGKLCYIRVWKGQVSEGISFGRSRIGGVYSLCGAQQNKRTQASVGSIVALSRLEEAQAGDILTDITHTRASVWIEPPQQVFTQAIRAENRQDEVKLTTTIHKIKEEDPSIRLEQNSDTGEMLLWGQGEIHLGIVLDKLRKYNIPIKHTPPQAPYKETITKGKTHHARYKRQTGGHGQFADIHIDIKPLGRGEGFVFTDSITGGVIPRQFIPAVKAGIIEAMEQGPLGFNVVDLSVNLFDGQFHSVDSSEIAFKTCGRQALLEALPQCDPILLEPILHITLSTPKVFTAKLQRLISGRRGQILGFDDKPNWKGWDEMQAYLPQSEMQDMIIELRSLTLGIGTFTWKYDRLQELTGRLSDKAIAQRAQLSLS